MYSIRWEPFSVVELEGQQLRNWNVLIWLQVCSYLVVNQLPSLRLPYAVGRAYTSGNLDHSWFPKDPSPTIWNSLFPRGLDLGIWRIWAWYFFVVGGSCLVNYRVFSSILGLFSLNAICIPPQLSQTKISPHVAKDPWEKGRIWMKISPSNMNHCLIPWYILD